MPSSKNKTRKLKTKFGSRIHLYSNPRTAQRMAHKYLGKTAKLYPASNPEKKYYVKDLYAIHFISSIVTSIY